MMGVRQVMTAKIVWQLKFWNGSAAEAGEGGDGRVTVRDEK